jgi:hypothetical protein
MRRILVITAAVIGLMSAMGPASATAFCAVKSTADGFVALRAAPSPDASIVARMRAGDEVLLVNAPQGRWQRVRWWRGEERVTERRTEPRASGWVNVALIEDCG